MALSAQQVAVVQWALNGSGSLNLVARAGCGKTFTLVELVKAVTQAFPSHEMFLGAYNKSIADELSERLKKLGVNWKQAQASTLHSAGFSAWRRVAGDGLKVDGNKVKDILQQLKESCELQGLFDKVAQIEEYGECARDAVSLAKQRALGFLKPVEDTAAWYDIIDHFGLDEDLPEDADLEVVVRLAIAVYKKSLAADRHVIDYDDMILAPLVHNARMWPKDWVLLDEAQDTNPARRALAIKMLKPVTGRLVAVGDPAQAIYSFTGADSNSMDLVKEQLRSAELTLTTTYRCAQRVVAFAQTWVPDLTAHETAPEGLLRTIKLEEMLEQVPTPSDVVLCRNTAPLVDLAFTLLKRGVGCKVVGKEIGEGLVKLAQRWKVRRLKALQDRLASYLEREVQKYLAKGQEEKAANVEDRVATLLCVISKLEGEGKTQITDLVAQLRSMFGDDTECAKVLPLMTGHRSKGLEWDRVFILGMNAYQPSKYARKDWQMVAERNLMYVMATRAKLELVLVEV